MREHREIEFAASFIRIAPIVRELFGQGLL